MVRLADLPEHERVHLLGKNLEPIGPTPFVRDGRSLRERRVALITTAGLHFRDDERFALGDASYRVIPSDVRDADLVMSHASVNFDRTGFQDDLNVVFPIGRFRELGRDGVIGSLASHHYSFMGALLLPAQYEKTARDLARLLIRDAVDTVFLTPV